MASNNYSNGLLEIQRQNIDYLNGNIKAIAVTGSFTFDKGHQFVSQISGEVSGTGYERKSLTGKSIDLLTGTPDKIQFKAGDIEYTNIDVSPNNLESLVIYLEVTDDNDSILLCNVNIPDISTNGTTITVRFPNGVVFEAENPIV